MSTLTVFCLCFVLVGGSLGNILTIIAVYINSNLQTLPNYLLVNLAVSEALRSSIAVPMHLTNIVNEKALIPCRVIVLEYIFFHGLPNWNLVLIAFDRFVAVKKSLSYITVVTPQLVRVLIAATWILMLVLVLLPLLGWGFKENQQHSSFACGLDTTLERSYIIFECIAIDILPFIIIVGLYSQVLAAVHGQVSRQKARQRSLKRLHEVQYIKELSPRRTIGQINYAVGSNNNLNTPNRTPESFAPQILSFQRTNTECLCECALDVKLDDVHKYTTQAKHSVNKSKLGETSLFGTKATRTVSCIILFFIMLCFPATTLDLIKLCRKTYNPPEQLGEGFTCLLYFNACVNVFIYSWCNRRFRKTIIRILKKIGHFVVSSVRCRC